jgi:hypothetical protein
MASRSAPGARCMYLSVIVSVLCPARSWIASAPRASWPGASRRYAGAHAIRFAASRQAGKRSGAPCRPERRGEPFRERDLSLSPFSGDPTCPRHDDRRTVSVAATGPRQGQALGRDSLNAHCLDISVRVPR